MFGTKYKPNWEYKTKSTTVPKIFLFWDIYGTSTKAICRLTTKNLWCFFIRWNSSWKWTFAVYNINNISKLQIKYYENKNWNVINWYNNWINLILKIKTIILLWKKLEGYPLHSRLEIFFLLDNGALISVPNKQTYMMIFQMFKACNHRRQVISKTLTIAEQFEVPIKQNNCLISFAKT